MSTRLGTARRRARSRLALVPAALTLLLAFPGLAAAAELELASVNGKGESLDRRSGLTDVSVDGRFAAFTIDLGLQPGCCAPEADVWVYDRRKGRGERVSGGPRDTRWHFDASLSGDGRYVAFVSDSDALVKRKTDAGKRIGRNNLDVFVYDRKRDRTQLISRDRGRGSDRRNISPVISADGRYVAFVSNSDDLGTGDQGLDGNRTHYVYVFDRKRKRTELVSKGPAGQLPDRDAWEPAISADGRYIAYYSLARNIADEHEKARYDVYRYDRETETTQLVSVNAAGGGPGGGSSRNPDISADGSRISFQSAAGDLVATDPNGLDDVFVRDLVAGTTELVSAPEGGAAGSDGPSETVSTISADGRFVGFTSEATNLAPTAVTGEGTQVYRRDMELGATALVSSSAAGEPADRSATDPAISGDGRLFAFSSPAGNLVRQETRRRAIFLADLGP